MASGHVLAGAQQGAQANECGQVAPVVGQLTDVGGGQALLGLAGPDGLQGRIFGRGTIGRPALFAGGKRDLTEAVFGHWRV